MADKKTYNLNTKMTKDLATKLQSNIDDLYKSTYFSDNDDSKRIDSTRTKMSDVLNGLLDKTKTNIGGQNISTLLSKVFSGDNYDMSKELASTLQDESLLSDIMDIYSQNVVTRDMDKEIDMVCKYMPKLDEAMDMKTDLVLSADHFEPDSIKLSVISGDSDTTSSSQRAKNNKELLSFKKKYNLSAFARTNFTKTDRYGENFIYIVAYQDAISRLLSKNNGVITESATFGDDGKPEYLNESDINMIVSENSTNMDIYYNPLDESVTNINVDDQPSYQPNTKDLANIKIELNKTGVIPSVVIEQTRAIKILRETSVLYEDRLGSNMGLTKDSQLLKDINKKYKASLKKSIDPKSGFMADDGFMDMNSKQKPKGPQIDVPGAIMEQLDHTLVRPLYLRNMCIGYYYFETDQPLDVNEQTTFSSTLGGLRPRRSTRDRENMMSDRMTDNSALTKIAKIIAQKIDANFINSNQDLSQEIYTILKFNSDHTNGKVSRIKVTFIPPEDIVHSYLDLNEKTHRGRSGLSKSLFSAKLYSCIYISNCIALMTRGYDKRIYHVRQTVDTNIHAVLLNVINQLKQSNMNLRQIENMNSILNITGRFNDIIVPQNANGESPVSFEVMPGQNIEIKTEFMQMLEEMSVNLTGITLSMVDSTQQDTTATHVMLNNTRVLIKILNIQKKYEDILGHIITKLYQYEYGTKDVIDVELPPPMLSKFTNITQIMASGNEVIQNILMMKGAGLPQNVKDIFQGKLMEFYFGSWIPIDSINKLLDDSKEQAEIDKGTGDAGGDMGGGGQMY